jgi:hypothetical protein
MEGAGLKGDLLHAGSLGNLVHQQPRSALASAGQALTELIHPQSLSALASAGLAVPVQGAPLTVSSAGQHKPLAFFFFLCLFLFQYFIQGGTFSLTCCRGTGVCACVWGGVCLDAYRTTTAEVGPSGQPAHDLASAGLNRPRGEEISAQPPTNSSRAAAGGDTESDTESDS